MKRKLYAASVTAALLLTSAALFSQSKSPVTGQQNRNISANSKKVFDSKFYPTLITYASPSNALAPGLVDHPDVRMHPTNHVQAEVTVMLNPANPSNIIASANTLLGSFVYNQGQYYSNDGGLTWSGNDTMQGTPVSNVYGDPTVCYSSTGTAFNTTIAANGGYSHERTTDGGATWSTAKKGNTSYGYDKGWSAADDQAASPYANYFYHSWTDFYIGNGAVQFNRSTDGGATFSAAKTIRSGTVGFGQGTSLETGPNGEIYVCWADHNAVISPYKADNMGFTRSLDGGNTFDAATKPFPYKGIREDGYSSVFNYMRVNDFPALACDKSNRPSRGRVYIAYPAKLNDTGRAVIYVRSSGDQGLTWSPAVWVSLPEFKQAYFPSITVDDATGVVWLAYMAFEPSGATGTTNTYVAASRNGGRKWYTIKASDVSHISGPIDNVNFAYGYAGDYIGITVNNNNAVVTWMDNRIPKWQIYSSQITVTTSFMQGSETENIIAANAKPVITVGPNPFSSFININAGSEKILRAEIFTESGVLVKQFANISSRSLNVADLPRGKYVINLFGAGKNPPVYSQKLIKN